MYVSVRERVMCRDVCIYVYIHICVLVYECACIHITPLYSLNFFVTFNLSGRSGVRYS